MNRMIGQGATLLLSTCCVVLLGSCGSGAVSAPPAPDPAAGTPLAVSPPTVDLFPDVPTTFTITGGRSGYTAFSSNNVVLPITTSVTGSTFSVVPNAVPIDTVIDVTVRDTLNASATAKATVRPSTLNSQITFTPLSPTGTGCGTGLCSGGDAQVVVKAVLNGVVLRSRAIRFDVYQGNFQMVTPGTGALVNSLSVSTDELGEAVVRIFANAAVPTQVATLQITDVTDVTSRLARRYNFNIVQATSGLSTLPSAAIVIKGATGGTGQEGICPSAARVDFYVFGGLPPYTIGSPLPGIFTPISTTVATSGGSFGLLVTNCGKASIIVTDSKGLAIETALIDSQRGDPGADATPTALTVSPEITTVGCNQKVPINTVGSGTFTATVVTAGADAPAFTVDPLRGTIGTSVTIARNNPASGPGTNSVPTSVTVNFIAGAIVKSVKVTVTGGVSSTPTTSICP